MDLSPHRWTEAGEALLPELVALRRAIHEEPEIGLHTPLTTAKAKAALEGLPLEIREGTSTTGFVAILRGPANGRTVLLRGDMDALPLRTRTPAWRSARARPAPCTPAATTPTSLCWPAPPAPSAPAATSSPAR